MCRERRHPRAGLSIAGLQHRARVSYLWKGSVSYVTGSPRLKVGYQHAFMTDDRTWMTNDQNLTYRFNNGVPNQLTQSISPWVNDTRVAWDGPVHPGAVDAGPPDASRRAAVRPGAELVPEATARSFAVPACGHRDPGNPRRRQLQGHHIEHGRRPRLFGNGRTALHMSLGRYLEGAGASGIFANTNPTSACRRRRRCSARPA